MQLTVVCGHCNSVDIVQTKYKKMAAQRKEKLAQQNKWVITSLFMVYHIRV